eukprot:4709530-Pleurochrysis_carterae.AAC.1
MWEEAAEAAPEEGASGDAGASQRVAVDRVEAGAPVVVGGGVERTGDLLEEVVVAASMVAALA